ncbi:MAG TPA: hypothetical protein VF746_15515 [Longimicrobium sp.]|jgi:tetratricopeptide (TPR) repeat protein
MSSARKLRRTALHSGTSARRGVEGIEIVYDKLHRYDWQTPEMDAVITRLHRLANESPREAIPELLRMVERHPHVPLFYNYLAVAYSAVGDHERADETIEENYRRNPDYLFARVNYAELCLRDGDLEGCLQALGERLDLQALYPHRRRFHISELTGFTYAVGLYQLKTGDRDAARSSLELLRLVAPGDRATKALERRLHPVRFLFRR